MNFYTYSQNNSYGHWQLELLMRSFILNESINKLHVLLLEAGGFETPDFKNLILTHNNKYLTNSLGYFHNLEYLDMLTCLHYFIKENIIEYPACFINPDCVLINLKINFQHLFEYQLAYDWDKSVENHNLTLPANFPCIGNAFVLKEKLDLDVIENSIKTFLYYENLNKKNNIKVQESLAMVSLGLNLKDLDYYPKMDLVATPYSYTGKENFINYQYGVKPYFFKSQFKYADGTRESINCVGPYEAIENCPILESCNYLRKLVGMKNI